MAINIRNEEAIKELRRLSELTGRSMSKELTVSIHERLQRVEAAGNARLNRLLRLAETSAQLWPPTMREGDPTDMLYDERGLPA